MEPGGLSPHPGSDHEAAQPYPLNGMVLLRMALNPADCLRWRANPCWDFPGPFLWSRSSGLDSRLAAFTSFHLVLSLLSPVFSTPLLPALHRSLPSADRYTHFLRARAVSASPSASSQILLLLYLALPHSTKFICSHSQGCRWRDGGGATGWNLLILFLSAISLPPPCKIRLCLCRAASWEILPSLQHPAVERVMHPIPARCCRSRSLAAAQGGSCRAGAAVHRLARLPGPLQESGAVPSACGAGVCPALGLQGVVGRRKGSRESRAPTAIPGWPASLSSSKSGGSGVEVSCGMGIEAS